MKQKIPLSRAEEIACWLVQELEFYCQRIEIAGSIRRQKAEVGDIEIVAIPRFTTDMFGELTDTPATDTFDLSAIGKVIKAGSKYKQIELALPDNEQVNLDLFLVTPPAQWGVQFLLRTGPAEYSHKIVTPRKHGGYLPSHLRVHQGAIWSSNHIIPTAEEQDVYDLLGMAYAEPRDRR